MQETLLDVLRCPQTGQRLHIEEPQWRDDRLLSGWLVNETGAW